MKTQVIVAAAGSGTRLKDSLVKALVLLDKKPLLIYCLEVFDKHPLVDSVIVVANQRKLSDFKRIISRHKIAKVTKVIPGGKTRRDSVKNGLNMLDKDTDCVVIHDGARPFVSSDVIDKTIKLAKNHKAAVVAVPLKPTIKKVNTSNMVIEKTLDRNTLWEIQTPQVFQKDVILRAHERNKDNKATDDAVLAERIGVKVKVVEGHYSNIKITTEDDLILARALLENKKKN